MHHYSYLALGDSYTIGEALPLHESFPYQAVQLLRLKRLEFYAPEIIAKTGWTTDELEAAVKDYQFQSKYDFVTLLIGVNNQYRGRDAIEYKEQFEELLKKAMVLAGGKKDRVIVISIPDWSVTPFAESKDRNKLAKELEVFNAINKAVSIQYKVQYIDITASTRDAAGDPSLLAPDGLHPSAIEYGKWAEKLAELILSLAK